MCGIAGVVGDFGRSAAEVLDRQLHASAHRGPDSSGVYEKRAGAIGQNRLAVIDLVNGDPPITNEDSSIGVALNGEIYNFRELRDDLRRSGHSFATGVDTEVIAHLAEVCSPVELASRLSGMFAFAVWDSRHDRLILGRDRFGKKPLYYWCSSGRLVFGSEIKSVLVHPDVPKSLQEDAIPALLTFGYVPTPGTFFEGIRSVPPGHVLVFEPGGEPVLLPYWSPLAAGNKAEPIELTFEEAAGEVRRLLTDAVSRRLVADVPLGAFLSGGVDSSTIVRIMADLTPRPVQTFTIGFEDEEGFDERPYARAAARHFGTDHHEFVVKPDAVELLERLVYHYDQPFGDSSAIPTFLLSELTRQHVTVALCGDGGDELFAGYERFAGALLLERYQRLPRRVRRGICRAAEAVPSTTSPRWLNRAARFAGHGETRVVDAFAGWISILDPASRQDLLRGGSDHALRDYRSIWERSEGAQTLHRLMLQNLQTYLVDDLLPKVDRTSMAHALEVRSPFLDEDLAGLTLRLPPDYHVKGFTLKRLLKHSVRDLLPPELLERKKQGFGVPLDRWLRSDLRSFAQARLLSATARVRAHVDPVVLDGLVEEHIAGRRNHGHALWTLLTLEVFLENHGW